ncbi:MAG: alpha/beta hydrolase [Candidatus Omnitrophica bacterium]|nr:alpha/beta hydrolase [Candidatus Omnitrophota bacterium]
MILWVTLGITIFVLLFLILSFIKYTRILSRNSMNVPFPSGHITASNHNHYDFINFKSADDILLEGKFIPADKPSAKTVIFCHELGADMNSWEKYCYFLPKNGFNVFTFDFRRSFRSDEQDSGKETMNQWSTQEEVEDVLGAIQYLKNTKNGKAEHIGIFGVSKGANLGICATGQVRSIKAVVSDGAFSTIETLKKYMHKWASIFIQNAFVYKNIPEWLYEALARSSMFYSGLKLKCRFLNIENYLKRFHKPILFIHGENDPYIPADQAHRFFSLVRSAEELWVVPEAGHNDAVRKRPGEYEEKVVNFYNEHI